MSQFHPALESFLAGRTDLPALEQQLRGELEREPALAPVVGTLLDEHYRSGRMPEQAYHTLSELVRATTTPAAPANQTDVSDGLTMLSPRATAGSAVATGSASDGLTVLSPRGAVSNDGLTQFRPAGRGVPGAQSDVVSSDSAVPEVDAAAALASARRNVIAGAGVATGGGSTVGGTTGATGSTTGGIAGWDGQAAAQPQSGDVIKERFVLEDIIGRGGMGVVFRARDLRKEEAQDRHPHVALKVLNEDFKRHPESLKALQREARKAQNLAHPNIVTVYDFDRDGANVYMVMELLEGEPLDRYIRRHASGLPFEQALPIIAALCRALGYAHQHAVVHSDFKPGNAFITRSGAIKVFDFGIARAAKHQDGEVTGDQTLFDAGTLGALTPAYASCEMLEGLEPDPRDDVYALGCVAYELLSGAHPFKGKSATRARDERLKPPMVRGLSRRQMRALRQSLAFERSQRSAGALDFLTALTPPPRSPGRWIAAGGMVVVAAAAGVVLVPSYLERRESQAIAALVNEGTAQAIGQALPKIHALDGDARARLLLDESVRSALVADFDTRVQALTDASQQRHDYPQAEALVAELATLLPDSQAVAQLRDGLATRKNEQIRQLGDQLDAALEQGWLIPVQGPASVAQVLQVLAQIDPEHPSLSDPRLPAAYADQIQLALSADDIELARQLSDAALAVVPGDSTLMDLDGTVHWEQVASRQVAQVAQLREQLRGGAVATSTLQEIDALHPKIALLHFTTSDDALLTQVQRRVQTLLDEQLDQQLQAGEIQAAQGLLARYADILPASTVEARRARIQSAQEADAAADSAQQAAVAELQSQLTTLLAARADLDREAQVSAVLAQLAAYLAPADATMLQARQQAAASYLEAGRQAREQGQLDGALRALTAAEHYAPDWERVSEELQELNRVREQQAQQRREERQAAQVAALRQKLMDQVRANDVQGAQASLTELRSLLPADDVFLNDTAPQAVSAALLRVAATASQRGDVTEALAMTDRALALGGSNPQVLALREGYARQLAADQAASREPAAMVAQAAPASEAPDTAAVAEAPPQVAQAAAETAAPVQTPARQQSRTGTCSASLAGFGVRSRGVCFDELPAGRGPELVVVPAAGSITAPFALGRFEISNADYAQYCQASGQCQPPAGEAELPLTGVGISAVEQYLGWLSATTGATYRLPTEQEWLHASGAPGSAERDYNCVVELNGQQIRGFSLVSARAGRPNGWGLYNLVGNAQEWVRTGAGLNARGGAFNDPISQCSPQLGRASDGAAAGNTGFRVLREL